MKLVALFFFVTVSTGVLNAVIIEQENCSVERTTVGTSNRAKFNVKHGGTTVAMVVTPQQPADDVDALILAEGEAFLKAAAAVATLRNAGLCR
jgi:hypothetical protein